MGDVDAKKDGEDVESSKERDNDDNDFSFNNGEEDLEEGSGLMNY